MPLPIAQGGLHESSQDDLVPSAARTASGASGVLNLGGHVHRLVIEVTTTGVAGTSPSLDLDLEDSFDGTVWNKVADVATVTATGRTVHRINLETTPTTNTVQLRWTITGTSPSFTFSVRAFAARG